MNNNNDKGILPDQRKHSRNDFPFLTIEYTLNSTSNSETCIGFVLNINTSGLCLKTNKDIKEGQIIIIKNLLFSTSKKAIIRWIQRSDSFYYKVGLEFI